MMDPYATEYPWGMSEDEIKELVTQAEEEKEQETAVDKWIKENPEAIKEFQKLLVDTHAPEQSTLWNVR